MPRCPWRRSPAGASTSGRTRPRPPTCRRRWRRCGPALRGARGRLHPDSARCAAAASPRRSGAGGSGTGCRRCAGRWCGGCWREHLDPLRAGPGDAGPLGGEAARRLAARLRRADLPAGRSASSPLLATLGAAGGGDAVPLDPQLRHPAALGLRPGAELHAADRRRLRGHPAPGAGAAAELVRAGAADPRRGPGRAAPGLAAGGLPRPHRGDPRRGSAGSTSSGRCREIADPAWTRSPASRRSAPPRRCRRTARAERRARVRAIFRADEPAAAPRVPAVLRREERRCCRRPMPPTSSGSPRSTRSILMRF